MLNYNVQLMLYYYKWGIEACRTVLYYMTFSPYESALNISILSLIIYNSYLYLESQKKTYSFARKMIFIIDKVWAVAEKIVHWKTGSMIDLSSM